MLLSNLNGGDFTITNERVEKQVQDFLDSANNSLVSAEGCIKALKKAIEGRKPGEAIEIAWIEGITRHIDSASCEISRTNGAVLVQSMIRE